MLDKRQRVPDQDVPSALEEAGSLQEVTRRLEDRPHPQIRSAQQIRYPIVALRPSHEAVGRVRLLKRFRPPPRACTAADPRTDMAAPPALPPRASTCWAADRIPASGSDPEPEEACGTGSRVRTAWCRRGAPRAILPLATPPRKPSGSDGGSGAHRHVSGTSRGLHPRSTAWIERRKPFGGSHGRVAQRRHQQRSPGAHGLLQRRDHGRGSPAPGPRALSDEWTRSTPEGRTPRARRSLTRSSGMPKAYQTADSRHVRLGGFPFASGRARLRARRAAAAGPLAPSADPAVRPPHRSTGARPLGETFPGGQGSDRMRRRRKTHEESDRASGVRMLRAGRLRFRQVPWLPGHLGLRGRPDQGARGPAAGYHPAAGRGNPAAQRPGVAARHHQGPGPEGHRPDGPVPAGHLGPAEPGQAGAGSASSPSPRRSSSRSSTRSRRSSTSRRRCGPAAPSGRRRSRSPFVAPAPRVSVPWSHAPPAFTGAAGGTL